MSDSLSSSASSASSSSNSDEDLNAAAASSSPWRAVLNDGEDEELECVGLRRAPARRAAAHLLCLALAGLPYLALRWRPQWRARVFWAPAPLREADAVLVKGAGAGGDFSVEEVEAVQVGRRGSGFPREYTMKRYPSDSSSSRRRSRAGGDREHLLRRQRSQLFHVFFHHRRLKYSWSDRAGTFVRVRSLGEGGGGAPRLCDFSDLPGFMEEEAAARRLLHGPNSVDVEVKSYARLLFEEVLNPFYVFQLFSIILWSFDNYVAYASCILLISLITVALSLRETRRQSQSLHDMVASSGRIGVMVKRGDRFEEVDSSRLVPGDVVAVPRRGGCVMSCDAVLLTGSAIVNESMLTGESVPVTKSAPTPDEEQPYNPDQHSRHTLFAGTEVIQTRNYGGALALALVARTGFSTAKGELVRSILYPRPVGFKFYRDSIRFILVLFGIACVGMAYCLFVYVKRGSDIGTIIMRCLDIVTVVVPPALPAAMTVGTVYAQSRLKKKDIFCISPQRINVCGKVKLVCFDKTGTLTEEGLDMHGVEPVEDGSFSPSVVRDVSALKGPSSSVSTCLASCHSLTLVEGRLAGDPLDVKMFEATGWSLHEEGEDNSKFDALMPTVVKPPQTRESSKDGDLPHEVGIIRQFPFMAELARMSVVTRTLGDSSFSVYVKGAPERLAPLCVKETLPKDFEERLKRHALSGFRVLGLAVRVLPSEVSWLKVQRMKRDQAERELRFLGFLIMRNKLKPQTTPVLRELREAKIRSVMVTGDNLLTAVSVARECGMVGPEQEVAVVEAEEPTEEVDGGERGGGVSFRTTERPDRGDRGDGTSRAPLQSLDLDIESGRRPNKDLSTPSPPPALAVSGHTWQVVRAHYPHLLPTLAVRGVVFARMKPEQKAQLVEEMQNLDYVASFCGDGANDCGALKAAHVGISLSEAEASVAAPFTSRSPDITCVPAVVREGRCALVTSFGVFKYMALYSIIQFVSVLMLYTLKTNLGDWQYLYIDLVITTTVALTMAWSGPHSRLSARRPPGSLVNPTNLFSIGAQILLVLAFQMAAYFTLSAQSWYVRNNPSDPEAEVIVCWETTAIFCVSSFQYLALAVAFSRGPPFRQPIYRNYFFMSAVVFLTCFTAALALHPGYFLAGLFQLEYSDSEPKSQARFRLLLLGLSATHLLSALVLEKAVVGSRWLKDLLRLASGKKGPKNRYKAVEERLRQDGWPPRTVGPAAAGDGGADEVHFESGIS